MRKMRLYPEELVVETFRMEEEEKGRRGTVHANQPTYGESCTCYDCGESGYYYSCIDTNCPSGCAVIYCDTYELCGGESDIDTCLDTCGVCIRTQNNVNTCVAPCFTQNANTCVAPCH